MNNFLPHPVALRHWESAISLVVGEYVYYLRYKGGGIGLASVRERVKVLGGSIDIGSGPGNGTSINIEITHRQSKNKHQLLMIEVAIVDDHPVVTSGLKKILDDAGHILVTGIFDKGNSLLENIGTMEAGHSC